MAKRKVSRPVILIAGSINTDMVVKTRRFPNPGETLLGGTFFVFPGGKGANQAVAAARMGGEVFFVGRVGNDLFGRQAMAGFKKEKIHTGLIGVDKNESSGTALITINQKGENTIVVAPGANQQITRKDIDNAKKAFEKADLVLAQLEIPLDSIEYLARQSARERKKMILNPAPARNLPASLYPNLYAITPNESEAGLLTGVRISNLKDAIRAGHKLLDKGVSHVVITLGKKGALYLDTKGHLLVPAPVVKAVDTTAAGDVFNGVLAVELAEGKEWNIAIQKACAAASLSVTRMGAQQAAPYRHELE